MGTREDLQAKDLRKRLLGVLVFRVVGITTLLGATLVRGLVGGGGFASTPNKLFISFIVATYVASIVYSLLMRLSANLRFQAVLQLVFDFVLYTAIIFFTGRNESPFTILYPFLVIFSAIFMYKVGAYLAATTGSIALAVLAADQYFHFLPVSGMMFGYVYQPETDSSQYLYITFINVFAMYMVAALASYLSEQIREKGLMLEANYATLMDLTALHESIVRSIPSGVITCDVGGRVTFANRTAAGLLGVEKDGGVGASVWELLQGIPELPEGDYELAVQTRGGRKVLSCQGARLNDHAGNRVGVLISFQDVTMLRDMEDKVRRSEKLAALGRVAAGLAHEIRNPLAAITGSVELLAGGRDGGEDNKALMRIVSEEADRLNELIEKFLMFARPVQPKLVEVDLSHLISNTVKMFLNDADLGQSVQVDAIVEPGIRVVVDPSQIKQVLWNLCKNAAQAAGDSGKVHVSVTLEKGIPPDGVAILSVTDDGVGIPTEVLAHVFDPFYTTKARGTGLGLSIAHSIVNAHGGTIEADSQPGHGSTFTIRFREQPLAM
jgi:two-component system sensor histidine kinase PilS (NtrC family)